MFRRDQNIHRTATAKIEAENMSCANGIIYRLKWLTCDMETQKIIIIMKGI